jgi:magnesium-transporting ATPase (P-type)
LGLLYGIDANSNFFDLPQIDPSLTGEDKIHIEIIRSNIHHTIIFNTFVFCQIFNEINSRKLNDELNIFKGLFTNWIFWMVNIFTIVTQILMVEFGGTIFETHGLNIRQWIICLLLASIEFPYGLFLRFIPTPDLHCFKNILRKKTVEENSTLIEIREDENMESIPLTHIDKERVHFLWKKAREVKKKINVVNALRRYRR